MLTAVVGATTNLLVTIYLESRPIQWEAFTYAKAESLQRAGKTVFFFGNPTYHVESQLVRQLLDDSCIALSAHRGELVPLMRTYADWEDSEIYEVWKRIGHTKHPMIVLFKPDGSVTKMEPLDVEEIERQFAAQSTTPVVPSLALLGTILLCGVVHYSRKKQTEQCRAPEDGTARLQMENQIAVPGDG